VKEEEGEKYLKIRKRENFYFFFKKNNIDR